MLLPKKNAARDELLMPRGRAKITFRRSGQLTAKLLSKPKGWLVCVCYECVGE